MQDSGYYKAKGGDLKNGRLMDRFGTPIVARFLATSPQTGAKQLLEKTCLWSYGFDNTNGVGAASSYTNLGLPDYDKAEVDSIEKTPAAPDDDITNWMK